MVALSDLITRPVSERAQEKAIDYSGRSIHYTYDRMQYAGSPTRRLPRIVVGMIIEEVFGELLLEHGIPVHSTGRTHWRAIDAAEFIVAGHRVDIKGYHVYPRADRDFPRWFLDVQGLIPVDQLDAKGDEQLFVQAFLVSPQHNHSTQHIYVAPVPKAWAVRWKDARRLHVTVNQDSSRIVLWGEAQDLAGQPQELSGDTHEELSLTAGITVATRQAFSSLQYLSHTTHLAAPPESVSIQIDRTRSAPGRFVVAKDDWVDLRLQGPTVTFAGWGFGADYRKGVLLNRGAQHKVYYQTRANNYGLEINMLRPISALLAIAK